MDKSSQKKISRDDMVRLPRNLLDGDPEAIRVLLARIPWGGHLDPLTTEALHKLPGSIMQVAIADFINAVELEEIRKKIDQLFRVINSMEKEKIDIPPRKINELYDTTKAPVKIPETYGIVFKQNADSLIALINKHFDELYKAIEVQKQKLKLDFIENKFPGLKREVIANLDLAINYAEDDLTEKKNKYKEHDKNIDNLNEVLKDELKNVGASPDAMYDDLTQEQKDALQKIEVKFNGEKTSASSLLVKRDNLKKKSDELKNKASDLEQEINEMRDHKKALDKAQLEIKHLDNYLNQMENFNKNGKVSSEKQRERQIKALEKMVGSPMNAKIKKAYEPMFNGFSKLDKEVNILNMKKNELKGEQAAEISQVRNFQFRGIQNSSPSNSAPHFGRK